MKPSTMKADNILHLLERLSALNHGRFDSWCVMNMMDSHCRYNSMIVIEGNYLCGLSTCFYSSHKKQSQKAVTCFRPPIAAF